MHKEESEGNENRVAAIRDYRAKIESEISSICDGILNLLNDYLVTSVSESQFRVFYLKMKGDYHRYLAEIKMAADREAAAQSALAAYTSAQDVALLGLDPTDPIRLELALNFSFFCYHILNSPDEACNHAKQVDQRSWNCTSGKKNSVSPPQLPREQEEQGIMSKSRKSASKPFSPHILQTHSRDAAIWLPCATK